MVHIVGHRQSEGEVGKDNTGIDNAVPVIQNNARMTQPDATLFAFTSSILHPLSSLFLCFKNGNALHACYTR